jgi:hypothetical protein
MLNLFPIWSLGSSLGWLCCHFDRAPLSLIIREMQIKTVIGYHLFSNRSQLLFSKTQKITSVRVEGEKFETLCIVVGNVKCCSSFEKQ